MADKLLGKISGPPAPHTDAEILAGMLAMGRAQSEAAHQAIAGILGRQAGRGAFAAELDAALIDQAAQTRRARAARLRAQAMDGAADEGSDAKNWAASSYEQERLTPRMAGRSAGDLACSLRLDSDARHRIPDLLGALGGAGVAFAPKDLRGIVLSSLHSLGDRRWALGALRQRALAGAEPEIAMAGAKESAKKLVDDLPKVFAHAGDGCVDLALELHGMGWATAPQMAELLAAAASHGSLEACQALAEGGVQRVLADASPDRLGSFAEGIRRLLRADAPYAPAKAASFIDGMSKLGLLAGLDAKLNGEAAGALGLSDAPYAAPLARLGPAPLNEQGRWRDRGSRRTSPAEALQVFAALGRAGLSIDAGKGLALFDASERVGARSKRDVSPVDLLLAAGADPKACGPRLFLRPAWWSEGCDAKGFKTWLAKLASAGMLPSGISKSCPAASNPVAACILYKLPLSYAAALLDNGAPAVWANSRTGETLLHFLADRSGAAAWALMERLLHEPGNRSAVDRIPATGDRESALMRACFRLDAAMAKILLDAGADPNQRDPAGLNALHHAGRKHGVAAQAKTLPLVQLLISRGADPSLRDAKGRTPGQAMAAKGPLGALGALLGTRPDDLLGADPAAKSAQAALLRRGGQAVSAVEEMILKGDPAPADAPKAKSRRI